MLGKLIRFLNMKITVFFMSCALGMMILLLSMNSIPGFNSSHHYCASQIKEYRKDLPASHPQNHCATPVQSLTWMNWLTGHSRTNQLHFIDFLELLHGNTRIPLSQVSSINSHQSLNLC